MNVQQEAVALWRYLEGRGFTPSVRSIGRALRDQGLKFRETSLREWLAQFADASRTQPPELRDAKSKHAGRSEPQGGTQPGRVFARAANVSLPSNNTDPSDRREPPKRVRRMKQPALNLGEATPPEIDHDKSRFAMPDNLPEFFPDPVDELREIAIAFVRVFANCKSQDKIRENASKYTDTLAVYRQKGKSVAVAWKCFLDCVAAQEWRPLFGAQSRKSLNYLPGGNGYFAPKGPRVDSCGHPLPAGVVMPKLAAGETAHWDGDEFIYGSDSDPV